MLIFTFAQTTILDTSTFNYTDSFIITKYFKYNVPSWWYTTFGAPHDISTDAPSIITDIFIDGVKLLQAETYAQLPDNIGTWFYNAGTGQLSIHFSHDVTPESIEIQYGNGFGFSDNGLVYIDSTLYLPYLKNVPTINKQEDLVGYSKPSYINASITVANENGVLDNLKDEALIGNTAFLSYIDDDKIIDNQASSADVIRLATWFIDTLTEGMDEWRFSVQDTRKVDLKVPTRTFLLSDYPNLEPSDEGKIVPLIYGKVRRAPCTPTNPTATGSTSATFRVGELYTTLHTVYVKINDTWVTRTPSSEDAANGTFTIPNARATSNDAPYECVADVTGIAIVRASDVIKDLYNRFANIPFNDLYYDTLRWAEEETALPTFGLVVSEKTDIIQVINRVQNGVYPGFRFSVDVNGKRVIIVDDRTKPISRFVDSIRIFNRERLQIEENSEFLFNSVTVAYDKEYAGGKLKRVTNDDYEDSVITNYQWKNTQEIELLLNDDDLATEAAAAKALEYSLPSRVAQPQFVGNDFFTTEIYDIIAFNTALDDTAEIWTGTAPSRPFFGVLVGQVLSVDPDYANKSTNMRLRILPDRTYSADINLLAADGDFIFGGDDVGFFEVVEVAN
jgi:hypothetical protein